MRVVSVEAGLEPHHGLLMQFVQQQRWRKKGELSQTEPDLSHGVSGIVWQDEQNFSVPELGHHPLLLPALKNDTDGAAVARRQFKGRSTTS